MQRGYIKEPIRDGVLYWVTKGSGTTKLSEAGIFTRAEFDALHPTTRAALEFVPVPEKAAYSRSDGSSTERAEGDAT